MNKWKHNREERKERKKTQKERSKKERQTERKATTSDACQKQLYIQQFLSWKTVYVVPGFCLSLSCGVTP